MREHARRGAIVGVLLVGLLGLGACVGSNRSAGPVQSSASGGHAIVGDAGALAYNPADGSLLRADESGLWRWRSDLGWQPINVPGASALSGVVVNPEQPQTLYISGPGLGVSRSEDGGNTWRRLNEGLPDLQVMALALHSFQRDTLYAWVEGKGIYRTEDGGLHWRRIPDQGPPDSEVRGLTHSTLPGSMNTGWLYAATPSGAYLSMDCF